ncbi:hypothetical protein CG51_05835 [Haematobacter missouriensis]|uniref:DUF3168 domain-containing protein n=1 Tax=Haematobacter missouriensis TaxID=366616 RepID=A0A212AQP1_9RHOB|nr:DUF3168 domain-containing protein [Haematobacter missouriensis]KFI30963.1 hypothetical protein CG51_05835 [Haematobacter missouriensis]OWJ73884.1 DUF3168 domain-containing protein [Haematobacter missouriensis]OWJ83820.1 DUF3168 domain-containing protein [Haematobacter missouriensis]
MTSVALQDVILDALKADAAVTALVGERAWDQAPDGADYPHITIGPSSFFPDDYDCITGRVETVQVDVWSRDQGRKWPCKQIVDAVKRALHDKQGDMGVDALVNMEVALCQIMDDPDGITTHGVVQVEALIEENDG